jgi:hypothetical protein
MMRIPWTARKTNAEILIETNEQRHITADLRRRQAKSVGQVLLKGEAGGHRDNRKNMWKRRQRKTTRKDSGQLDLLDGEEDCN